MRRISKLILFLGGLLVAASLGLLLFTQVQSKQALAENAQLVENLYSILPPPTKGIMESYSDNSMPALEIDGTDYSALVDIPALGITLPVADAWDKHKVALHPCRFYGSAYDGSLIIGGVDQPGQFADFKLLSLDAEVTITDMTGAVFTYAITEIEWRNSADAEVLLDSDAHLTLFVRNAYGTDYILLRCMMR